VHTARDGLRWHLIETSPGYYDWSSFLPMLKAANRTGIRIIWDLCHHGWRHDIGRLRRAVYAVRSRSSSIDSQRE
jgi:hypothetical protein